MRAVSIAGAILWGFERDDGKPLTVYGVWFQSQARFFGALSAVNCSAVPALFLFQSQARFFGALSVVDGEVRR